jgi:hypothetical protein
MHTIKKSILFFAVLAILAGMFLAAVYVADAGLGAAEPGAITWLADLPEHAGLACRVAGGAMAEPVGMTGLVSGPWLPSDFPGVIPMVAWGS